MQRSEASAVERGLEGVKPLPWGIPVPPRFREWALAVFFLVGLILVLAGPALSPDKTWYSLDYPLAFSPWKEALSPEGRHPRNDNMGDQDFLYYPFLRFIGEELQGRGELPLWNPHLYGGVPLAGNAQFPLLYPVHGLLWFSQVGKDEFDQRAFDRAFLWHGLLRMVLCTLGAWFWFRRLGGGGAAATAGALILGFGGYMVLWLQYTPAQVFCLLPPALLFLEGYIRRGSRWELMLYGLCFGASNLGGYPQTSFFLGGFLLLYALVRLGFSWRRLWPFLLASLAAGLVAMPAYLPFFEYLGRSVIGDLRAALPLWPTGPAIWLIFLAMAGAVVLFLVAKRLGRVDRWGHGLLAGICGALALLLLNSPYFGGDGQLLNLLWPGVWGRSEWGTWAVQAGLPNSVEVNCDYLGAAGILLLLLTPAVWRQKWNRLPLVLTGVVLLAWLYGAHTPLLYQLGRKLLFIAEASRAGVLFYLAGGTLAVFTFQRIVSLSSTARRQLVPSFLVILVGLVTASLVWKLGWWDRRPLPDFPVRDLAAVGLTVAVIWWLLHARQTRLPALALVGVLALDLLSFGWGVNPATPLAEIYPETPAITWLKERQREARKRGEGYRVMGDRMTFRPNTPLVYGLSDVRGHDCFDPDRYTLLLQGACKPGATVHDLGHGGMRMTERVFDLLGARYYCTAEEWAAPAGWQQVFRGPGMGVYENQDAIPRVFLASEQLHIYRQPIPYFDPAVDPRQQVFLLDEKDKLPGPAFKDGAARLLEDAPNRVRIRTQADGWSWLVLLDNDYPGWRARLDDKQDLRIRVAYNVYRCVPVPPGEHEVVFTYAPLTWRLGLWLSLVGLVIFAGLLLVPRRWFTGKR